MTTAIPNRVPQGVSTGGQFAPETRSEGSLVLGRDVSAFPHPDKQFPHPMEYWPKDVPLPAAIEFGTEDRLVGNTSTTTYTDPQNDVHDDLPVVTVTMPNGATYKLAQVTAGDFGETEEAFEGNWETYVSGDKDRYDGIIDAANETFAQASR